MAHKLAPQAMKQNVINENMESGVVCRLVPHQKFCACRRSCFRDTLGEG